MRGSIESPSHSTWMIAAHVSTLFGSFVVGLVSSGTFWYAAFIYLLGPSPSILPPISVVLLAVSCTMTSGFVIAKILLRGRSWMKYTTLTFLTGGFLAALVGILLIGLEAWAYSIAGSGG